jgi:DNA gyrase subunit A
MLLSELTGKIVSARVVNEDDEVNFISTSGIILRTSVSTISRQSRFSRGVSVMDMKDGDAIVSVAIVREGHLSEGRSLSEEDESAGSTETTTSPDGNERPSLEEMLASADEEE